MPTEATKAVASQQWITKTMVTGSTTSAVVCMRLSGHRITLPSGSSIATAFLKTSSRTTPILLHGVLPWRGSSATAVAISTITFMKTTLCLTRHSVATGQVQSGVTTQRHLLLEYRARSLSLPTQELSRTRTGLSTVSGCFSRRRRRRRHRRSRVRRSGMSLPRHSFPRWLMVLLKKPA